MDKSQRVAAKDDLSLAALCQSRRRNSGVLRDVYVMSTWRRWGAIQRCRFINYR